ncbi:AlpA family transcriptional regulator [Thioalkalivibrio sp. ALJ15]|uniref:helix-turn-helix transcriptional regulator n=1 Tax=Thioalkalivibrio sp. ALJ15 TaxID=748652 RepID=UPI00048BCDAF|nr:AlpA family phage regulatory protein [Thioalkalivibrio sp. ALJ15]
MNTQDHPAAILRPNEAAPYLGMSRRKLYDLSESDPTFPRKIVFSSRCVGWRREALDAWLRGKEGAA